MHIKGLFLSSAGTLVPGEAGGGEFFVSDDEICSAFQGRFGEKITKSELRLLKHLLAGHSLQTSGESETTYSTRRKQLGILRHKTGLSRQSEIVQVVTVVLLMKMFGVEREAIH